MFDVNSVVHSSFRHLFLVVVLMLATAIVATAQVQLSPQVEKDFDAALTLYRRADYGAAAAAFGAIVRLTPPHQRTTAAVVMKAKAELYGENAAEALKTAQSFLSLYPRSSYVADVEFTLGLAYLKLNDYEQATAALLRAYHLAATREVAPTLQEEILASLDETINSYLTLDQLRRFDSFAADANEQQYLELKLAEKHIARGDYPTATTTLQEFRRKFPRSLFDSRLSDLEAKIMKPKELKLGILLPLMKKSDFASREKEVGQSLLQGLEFAVEEFNAASQQHVSLEIRDSERELSTSVSEAKRLAADPSILCILGPAFSAQALAVAPVANEFHVSLVTPTANANGIAATGPYVFQANPDLETRARAMAQYAVKDLKLKRLAILASSELTSKSLAQTFEREARRQGAEVVAIEFYEKGMSDLMLQLMNMRRKAHLAADDPYLHFSDRLARRDIAKLQKLGVPQRTLDTLLARGSKVNATDLLGANARSLLDSAAIPYMKGNARGDSVGVPLRIIEGLYCPISTSAEIGVVASQLAYFNIQTKILGTGEWNNLAELNANRMYCKNVVFESDSYIDVKNPEYQNFVNRFTQSYNKSPNRNTLYGYGVAKAVLSALRQDTATREKLRDALSDLRSYEAPHARISLAPLRVNTWLHIFEYSQESIRHIREINVE
ncbi:MAG: ABC transporter substrate-binding protein [Ignavibacteriae bacterium]|nr:ABC transporter substrate-binding protein [Ignavibacteriota bacterium]